MTVASSSPPSRLPGRAAEGARTRSRTRGHRAREGQGDGPLAALFIAPAMLGFLVFLLWPTLRGIYLSFTRFNLLTRRSGSVSTTMCAWSTTPSSGTRCRSPSST